MQVTYSNDVDAGYIAFKDIAEGEIALSLPITDDLILDVDHEGNVLGLELLNASGFFENVAKVFGGKLELPKRVDPDTFDAASLLPAHA